MRGWGGGEGSGGHMEVNQMIAISYPNDCTAKDQNLYPVNGRSAKKTSQIRQRREA